MKKITIPTTPRSTPTAMLVVVVSSIRDRVESIQLYGSTGIAATLPGTYVVFVRTVLNTRYSKDCATYKYVRSSK